MKKWSASVVQMSEGASKRVFALDKIKGMQKHHRSVSIPLQVEFRADACRDNMVDAECFSEHGVDLRGIIRGVMKTSPKTFESYDLSTPERARSFFSRCAVASATVYEHCNSFPYSVEFSFSPHAQAPFVCPFFEGVSRGGTKEEIRALGETYREVEGGPFDLVEVFRFHHDSGVSTLDALHHREELLGVLKVGERDGEADEDQVTVLQGSSESKGPVRLVYLDKNTRCYPVLRGVTEMHLAEASRSRAGGTTDARHLTERVLKRSEDAETWRVELRLLREAFRGAFFPPERLAAFASHFGGVSKKLYARVRAFDLRKKKGTVTYNNHASVERVCGVRVVISIVLPPSF